jgi:hypothetical protein
MSANDPCARMLCRRQRQAITVLLPFASTAILERQEKAGAGARAKWARMTPEQRSKDAEKRATKGWKTRRAKLEAGQ